MLQLPAGQVERFASGNGVEAGQIQGMYLNIRYEDGALYCITGLSLGFFTLDKTLEDLWDRSAEEFLAQAGNRLPAGIVYPDRVSVDPSGIWSGD